MTEVISKQDIADVRRDISEVLSVLRGFVDQVDKRFTGLEERYGHAIGTSPTNGAATSRRSIR